MGVAAARGTVPVVGAGVLLTVRELVIALEETVYDMGGLTIDARAFRYF